MRTSFINGLTLSEDGCGVDGPLPPALLRDFLLGAEVVGQRDADDGHRLGPRPVAVRVRADDLRPRHVGLVLERKGDVLIALAQKVPVGRIPYHWQCRAYSLISSLV